MSIKTIDPQRSFYHTSYLCGELFGPTDRYRLFREKIWPKLLELGTRLHSFYCEDNGRPAIDPVRLAGVTLLQFMEKAPDRVAAERTLYHLGWKYALDLELGAGGFHSTVLVYFRDRLEEKKAERVIFDAAVDLLVELGLIKRKGKQRLDSTHIVGYVKEMSRLECATETMRLALRDLESELRGDPRPEFWQGLWALYVQSQLDWRMSKAEREGRYLQCGQDMRRLLEWLERHRLDFSELESVRLLRRVFGEQFEEVEQELAAKAKRPARAVRNPHDPDAHYAEKRKKQWVGYKVHVVESVEPEKPAKKKGEPTENFITEILTVEAAQDEMAGWASSLKDEQQHHELEPITMYGDAGYVTESTLVQAEQNGMELLGPCRPDPHKGPYNADAFHVDVDQRQAVCPQGNVSTQCSRITDTYMGTQYYRFEWASQCDRCPVQKQCTRSKTGRRLLVVGLRHDLVEKRRAEMRQTEFAKSMHPRNGIEATHSELVRGHGLRRTKYRGFNRVRLSHYFMGAACNVKRFLNLLAFQIKAAALNPA
jgi:transposase